MATHYFSIYEPINESLLFPVLWVNENAEVTEEDAEILKRFEN